MIFFAFARASNDGGSAASGPLISFISELNDATVTFAFYHAIIKIRIYPSAAGGFGPLPVS